MPFVSLVVPLHPALSWVPAFAGRSGFGDHALNAATSSIRPAAASFFAVSCRAGANILYEKMLISGDVESAFRITYPATAHAHWDAVTARMSASLTEGR